MTSVRKAVIIIVVIAPTVRVGRVRVARLSGVVRGLLETACVTATATPSAATIGLKKSTSASLPVVQAGTGTGGAHRMI